jgi:hypothetical protein
MAIKKTGYDNWVRSTLKKISNLPKKAGSI